MGADDAKKRGAPFSRVRGKLCHNPPVADKAELFTISLAPDPVIEAYKRDVDRTLIRENLKLSVTERVQKLIGALHLADELRRSRRTAE